jgi:hypothetical protein
VARFYVFSDEGEAVAAVSAIDDRARTLYAARGFTVDENGDVVGRRASDGADMPDAARTETWDVPLQRSDGKWIVAHVETCPGHDVVIDAAGTPVWRFVGQDVTAPIETMDATWFPLPPDFVR